MRKFILTCVVSGFLVVGLAGCANNPLTGQSTVATTVDNSIVGVERSFTLSLDVARLYTDLPRCGAKGSTQICSDPKIVLEIRNLAIKAHNAILAARQNGALIGVAIQIVGEFGNSIPKS